MMQRATIIDLAGRAFHVDERGVAALEQWLADARTRLDGDPDRDELLLDFERAIAGRFEDAAPAPRDVVGFDTVEATLAAIGTVQPADATETSLAPDAAPAASDTGRADWRSRKLYRLTGDDAMITGVCAGLAAYLRVDVTVVRVAFVLLALVTSGAFAIVYIAMAVIVPEANTPAERAALHGYGDTANELLARARDGAGPALQQLGSVLGTIWHVLVRALHLVAISAFWLVIAVTIVASIASIAGVDALLATFDDGTPKWLAALFYTCIGWIAAAVLLWIIQLCGALDPRTPSRRRRRMEATWNALLAATWVAAILGAVAIPAAHSSDFSDVARGHGRTEVLGLRVCTDWGNEYTHTDWQCPADDDVVIDVD